MLRKAFGLLMAVLLVIGIVMPTPLPAAADPPMNDLVAWWPGNGNADDLSGNAHNGTLVNGATFATGKVGQGFSFDGYDDHVSVPDSPSLDGMSQLTAAAWVKFNELPYWKWQIILFKGEGNGRWTNAYGIWLAGDTRRIGAAVESEYELRQIEAPTEIVPDRFYHVAITSDGATFKLYVDGIVRASTPFVGAIRSTWYPFLIGKRSAYRYPSVDGRGDVLNGVVDEVVVYNRALSASEIQSLASSPPSDSTPPVIAPTVSGIQGDSGWYTSDVNVSWSVTDSESAVTATSGCNPSTVSTDTGGATFTCTATSAGGTASETVIVKRDTTPPSMQQGDVQGTAGQEKWYRSDVVVGFTAADGLSGLRSVMDGSFSLTAGGEGAAVSTDSKDVYDQAGNKSTAGPLLFKIDKTAPTVSLTGPSVVLEGAKVGAMASATDDLSGLIAGHSGEVFLDTSAPGTSSITWTVTDRADNSATATLTYKVLEIVGPLAPLEKNGKGTGQFKAGSTIPVKFQIKDGASLVTGSAGTVTIDSVSAPFRWDATSQQYVANVKTGGGTGTFPVVLNVNEVGSTNISSVEVR